MSDRVAEATVSADLLPLTVEFLGSADNRVLHTMMITGPGASVVPSKNELGVGPGERVKVRITDAAGRVTEEG